MNNSMRALRVTVLAVALVFVPVVMDAGQSKASAVGDEVRRLTEVEADEGLSPIWGSNIRQWSEQIFQEARANGLDPDFIAAVMDAESNGDPYSISRVGAVGLMGIMPAGPGLEWRPSSESLIDPEVNLSWGTAILTEIIRQSGGDIFAALAAYSGGWDYANSRIPKAYARGVLDGYGRAVAVRSGISPQIASEWTVATEVHYGHISVEPLLLSDEPVSGLRKYGEHVVFNSVDAAGSALFIKGYAVPLALVVPLEGNSTGSYSELVDTRLLARLGMVETKIDDSNPRVILACLPSLSRLRGRLATRWYAPASCPSWHR